MSREDASIAFTRHSTSKIRDIDDLMLLNTLGFRGEALASICAVSRVEMATRERGAPEERGTRISVAAGVVTSITDIGCPEGTSVTVTDLFSNVPARKKFLRSAQTERAHCIDVVSRTMMVRPDAGIVLTVDGEERINSGPGKDLRNRVAAVIGVKTARAMVDLPARECGGIKLTGLISLPWDTRANSAGLTLAVNGRVIKNRPLVDAIRKGYGSRLMTGRFPLGIITMTIPGGKLDVNVHPTKDLVKFSDEGAVLDCIEAAVSAAIFSPGAKREKGRGLSEEGPGTPEKGQMGPAVPKVKKAPPQAPLMEGEVRPQVPPSGPWAEVPRIEGYDRLPPALPENAGDKPVRIIGQLDRSYILCELGPDLLLVDQHAAHERVRLERLQSRYNAGKNSVQELLDAVHLELPPAAMESLEDMAPGLEELGFRFERFGRSGIAVRGLPLFMGRMEGPEVIRDLAMGIEFYEGCAPPDPSFMPRGANLRDRVIALTSCRGAVKAHQTLSLNEMEELLTDLLKCEVPLHCAHGRPTMLRLPQNILEKWFKRVL